MLFLWVYFILFEDFWSKIIFFKKFSSPKFFFLVLNDILEEFWDNFEFLIMTYCFLISIGRIQKVLYSRRLKNGQNKLKSLSLASLSGIVCCYEVTLNVYGSYLSLWGCILKMCFLCYSWIGLISYCVFPWQAPLA
jgi:hypothetical protein